MTTSDNECGKTLCINKASWSASLVFRASMGTDAVKATGSTGLMVCGPCRERVTVHDFVTDESWPKLLAAFQRGDRLRPIRMLTRLVWEPITGRLEIGG